MSNFSNAGPTAEAGGQAYTRALLDLLGDRDPIQVLTELPHWLRARVAGIDDQRLRRPEAPGKWAAIEVIQHLADSEIVYGYRIRIILERDGCPIVGYDQDVWARELDYRHWDLSLSLAQLDVLRHAHLALYRRLKPEALARSGLHSERGRESVSHIIRLLAAHDLVHRRQLDRILGA